MRLTPVLFFLFSKLAIAGEAADPCGLGIPFEQVESYAIAAGQNYGPNYVQNWATTKTGSRLPFGNLSVAEIGKELSVRYTGGIIGAKKAKDDEVKFRMGYKTQPEGDRYLDLKLENFDPGSQYNSATGTLTVPASKIGAMEIWFEAVLPNGEIKYDSNLGANYKVRLIDASAGIRDFCFSSDWNESVQGEGKVIRVNYDRKRILDKLEGQTYNGFPAYRLYGYARFIDAQGETIDQIEFPLEADKQERVPARVPVAALLPIPDGAKELVLWFKGSGRGRPFFDSDFSKDYHFGLP